MILIRRDKDRSGKEQWLLLHKKDEFAVPGWDTEAHGQSVKTGRTNDEVAADPDARWDGDAPAAEAEVSLRRPIRATFAEPTLPAAGIAHVFVNGRPVWSDAKPSGERPGRPLRRQQMQAEAC